MENKVKLPQERNKLHNIFLSFSFSSTGQSSITVVTSWCPWGWGNTKPTTGPGATRGRSSKQSDFLFMTANSLHISVSSLSALHCHTLPSLSAPNLTQTHRSFHCMSYRANGSSVDCCVHQSVMNINKEPPTSANLHHSSTSWLVCSNSSGDFLPLHLHSITARCTILLFGTGELKGKNLSIVITSAASAF